MISDHYLPLLLLAAIGVGVVYAPDRLKKSLASIGTMALGALVLISVVWLIADVGMAIAAW